LWNNKKTLLIIGLFIAAAAAAAVGLRLTNSEKREYRLSEDASDGEYVMADIDYQEKFAEIESNYFRIQINARPEVQESRCNLMAGNPSENEADMQIVLILDDSGTEIFRSEILKPGERKAYVRLTQQLEPGEYAATALFQILGPDSDKIIAEIEAGVIITVQS